MPATYNKSQNYLQEFSSDLWYLITSKKIPQYIKKLIPKHMTKILVVMNPLKTACSEKMSAPRMAHGAPRTAHGARVGQAAFGARSRKKKITPKVVSLE